MQAWVQKAQEAFGMANEMYRDLNAWKKIHETEGITCSRRPNSNSDYDTFKADVYLDKSPSALARYMFDNNESNQEQLNGEIMESSKIVNRIAENVKIVHSKIKGKGPVSGRDLVTISLLFEIEAGTQVIVTTSIDHDIPAEEGVTRADLVVDMVMIEPVAGDAKRAHMANISLFDMKGSLPSMIVNTMLDKQAQYYVSLKERLLSAV